MSRKRHDTEETSLKSGTSPQKEEERSPSVAHLDCSSGVSGDMVLGALLDAGLPFSLLQRAVARLGLSGCRLHKETVHRGGVRATSLQVRISGPHPVRRWRDAHKIITASRLDQEVKQESLRILKSLFLAEAEVHGVPWTKVHLHELGAVDCLVDIVGAVFGFRHFGVEHLSDSSINTGSGQVRTEHGLLPVPAPATAVLLRGLPVYSGAADTTELTTPTGAALVSGLGQHFGALPEMVLSRVGTGAGSRNTSSRPNVLRLFMGRRADTLLGQGSVIVMETNIDDMDPRIYEHVMERLLGAGALDVFLTPLIMKKSRPAVRLSVIALPETVQSLQDIVLKETTTLGVRVYEAGRRILDRRLVRVLTPYGRIRVKIASIEGRVLRRVPEYEDCRRAAVRHSVPLRKVLQAAEKESRQRP